MELPSQLVQLYRENLDLIRRQKIQPQLPVVYISSLTERGLLVVPDMVTHLMPQFLYKLLVPAQYGQMVPGQDIGGSVRDVG
jgi:hypothetical protein